MFNTALLMGVLFAIFLVVGFALGGALGITVAFALALLINLASYWFSDRIVLGMYKAKPSENSRLKAVVAGLAKEAKIPAPKLYEVDSKVPNAFATGRNPRHAAVAVTKGLLELDDDEMEGVLAHEISHIRNHDILVSTMAATIGGAIAYLAQMGYYMMFAGDRENQGNIVAIVLIAIFAPLAALLIRLAISRNREYGADKSGALITKNPKALASALRKISQASERNPMRGHSTTADLWIINPFHKDWFTGLFSTHPPIQKRIERLEELAGE
jgi:heat shock protein HtpX